MIVPFHQHDVGACTRRGDRGGSPGRTAPGDQYIAITEQWHLARRLGDRSRGAGSPLAQAPCAEHLSLEE